MAPAEIFVSNNPIITVSQLAGTVYKSLFALDVLGNAVVGTSPIVALLNSVAIITPYNATAIAMAKDSEAALTEAQVSPPVLPDCLDKY